MRAELPVQVDIVVLASQLATVGYRVAIRTAMGGGSGQRCFRNLCYEFLLVSSFEANAVQYVVDPKFRYSLLPAFSARLKVGGDEGNEGQIFLRCQSVGTTRIFRLWSRLLGTKEGVSSKIIVGAWISQTPWRPQMVASSLTMQKVFHGVVMGWNRPDAHTAHGDIGP